MAVVTLALLLFHYLVIALNMRVAFKASGTAIRFLRVGLFAYILTGVLDWITSFRGVALETQFTFLTTALEQLGSYGAISMMFFGAIYYMVPRIAGAPWASSSLATGHRILVVGGIVLSVVTLTVAGLTQGDDLLDAKVSVAHVFTSVRLSLLMNSGAQVILLGANLLFVVNFFRTACAACCGETVSQADMFRQPAAKMEVHAS
jgi:cytochrome c oxidase cbb3-type subunit 1